MGKRTWRPSAVIPLSYAEQLIDYAPAFLREAGASPRHKLSYDNQLSGAVHLHNMLCNQRYAYLADEVGTGKTVVALGVVSLLLARKPDARVVVVVPRHGVANQWVRDWNEFSKNIVIVDHPDLRDPVIRRPVRRARQCLSAGGLFETLRRSDQILPVVSIFAFRYLQQRLKRGEAIADETPELRKVIRRWLRCKSTTEARRRFDTEILPRLNKKVLKRFLGENGIDLLLIDEAQCLRHPANLTNTTLAGLLGLRSTKVQRLEREVSLFSPLVDRVLFISATPMHRCPEDLYEQLAYAHGGTIDEIAELNQKEYMLRRLRRLAGYTQYDYRTETSMPAKPSTPQEHLLLAVSQKLFESCQHAASQSGHGRFEMGFLETFESYGSSYESALVHAQAADAAEEDVDSTPVKPPPAKAAPEDTLAQEAHQKALMTTDDKGRDDRAARMPIDRLVLVEMQKAWKEVADDDAATYPPHPKYEAVAKMVRDHLQDCSGPEKTIIFVRRIRGTKELAGAVQNEHNKFLWQQLNILAGGTTPSVIRGALAERHASDAKDSKSSSAKCNSKEQVNPLELFMGEGSLSKWRRRLRDARSLEVARLFHESPLRCLLKKTGTSLSEVLGASGTVRAELKRLGGEALRRRKTGTIDKGWYDWLVWERTIVAHLGKSVFRQWQGWIDPLVEVLGRRLERNRGMRTGIQPLDEFVAEFEGSEHSIWEKCATEFGVDEGLAGLLDDPPDKDRLWTWELQKEWARLLLLNTEGLILLLAGCTWESKKTPTTSGFVDALENAGKPLRSRATWRPRQLLNSTIFNSVKRQILGRRWVGKDSKNLLEHHSSPPALRHRMFARAVSGENGKDGLVAAQRGFNSPGYPDFLVTTDVMREGLDLHLFCRQVLHYGIAWSAGDLEQRNGRCDRLFSRTNRILEKVRDEDSTEGTLRVKYPVLIGSIDERQVARIITVKQQIADLLGTAGVRPDCDAEERTVSLQEAFRRLELSRKRLSGDDAASDPYPAQEELLKSEYTSMNRSIPKNFPSGSIRMSVAAHLSGLFRKLRGSYLVSTSRSQRDETFPCRVSSIDCNCVVSALTGDFTDRPLPEYLGDLSATLVYPDRPSEDRSQSVWTELDCVRFGDKAYLTLILRSTAEVSVHRRLRQARPLMKQLADESYPGAKLCWQGKRFLARKDMLVCLLPRDDTPPLMVLDLSELRAAVEAVAGLADHLERSLSQKDNQERIDG